MSAYLYWTYEEWVCGKVEFAFSHIELLKNRSNFVSQIVKFTNFDVPRTAADEYVSG